MARVIIFDVNETLLDMGALDPHFERIFGEAAVREDWFQVMKEVWLVSIITGRYADFGALARAALQMVGEKRGVQVSEEDRAALVEGMAALPPYPEVAEALRMLREAGFRLAALTNGTPSAVQAQLRHGGLAPLFEQILSADEVERLKPAPEPYRMAAERLGVAVHEIRMVATHAWDLAGAAAAGCATAYVARPRKVLYPLGPAPDLQGGDLLDLARKILEADRPA